LNNWLICIGKNGGTLSSNILIDNVPNGTNTGGSGGGNYKLAINIGNDEKSDWALSYVIIWDRHLTDGEMLSNSTLLSNYLSTGNIPSFPFLDKTVNLNISNNSIYYNLQNFSLNQEVNLIINDGNTISTGLTIYKSSNHDAFIINKTNNILSFGTNNSEKIKILNSGNIGIGTTNPSSIFHIHNSNSNQDVNLYLSSSFLISKKTNNEGIIWNSNNGIIFGTNNNERLLLCKKNIGPWGVYSAGNFSNNPLYGDSILYDISGNERHATVKGVITSNYSSGNGATSNIKFISGNINSKIIWPVGSIPENYTILSLTRYATGTNKKILVAKTLGYFEDTWFHGHNNGNKGVCYYKGWKTSQTGLTSGNTTDWVNVIGKNQNITPNNILINGVNSGTNMGGAGNLQLGINFDDNDWIYANYFISAVDNRSHWALSYVVIWDRHLTDDEMKYNSALIQNYLNTGIEPSFNNIQSTQSTSINITSKSTIYNINYNISNQEIKITNNNYIIYKSINNNAYIWNNLDLSKLIISIHTNNKIIINKNFIGIGIANPLNELHVNSNINASYFRGSGTLVSNLSILNFTKGSLNIKNGGLFTNNLIKNQILIGNGTNSIYQTSNLYWNFSLNRLGINTNNPQYDLDVKGTINANIFRGNGSNITNINVLNINNGLININNGGTKLSSLTQGKLFIYNGTSFIAINNITWDNINNRFGIIKNIPTYDLDVNGTINATYLRGNGSNITNFNAGNLSGLLTITNGGTGKTSLALGQLLIGNGTNAIIQTSNLFWDNTNNRLGINNNNPLYELNVNGTLNGNILSGNGCNITNLNYNNLSIAFTMNPGAGSIIPSLSFVKKYISSGLIVNNGCTGIMNPASGQILIGNETKEINQTSNLFWDNTNNRLGIINSTPLFTLDIIGDINFTGDIKQSGKIYKNSGLFKTTDEWEYNMQYINILDEIIKQHVKYIEGKYYYKNARLFPDAGLYYYYDLYNTKNVGIGIENSSYLLNVKDTIYCSNDLNFNYIFENKGQFDTSHGYITNNIFYINRRSGIRTDSVGTLLFNNDNDAKIYFGYQGFDMFQFNINNNNDITSNGFEFNALFRIGENNSFTGYPLSVENKIYTKNNAVTNYYRLFWNGPFINDPYIKNNPTNLSGSIIISYQLAAYFLSHIHVNGDIINKSDNRIKKDIKNIKIFKSFFKIKPKTYKYIDFVEKGDKIYHGFIAQEVRENIPEAVETRKDIIHNIYKLFDCKDDIIETKEDLRNELNINDNIQIIDKKNEKTLYKILEISPNHIKIDKNLNDNKCFILGKEVEDFHILDEKTIFTINVSIIKKLKRKLKKLKKIMKEQELKFEKQEEIIKYLFNNK
jgi:hypothetical protein